MPITLSPNQRFAIVGKTGSGKTLFTVVLASLMVPMYDDHWELWWLDSKLDPRDGKMLADWGFVVHDPRKPRRIPSRKRPSSRKRILLHPANGPISEQAQDLCNLALERRNVLVVCDEYKHVVQSARRAGDGIQGVHLRGRGLNVGQCGQTQEPVDIPRQLLSQATHVFLFDLSYPVDIKYAQTLFAGYRRPPDPHGFWHSHVDGDGEWRYYPHVKAWHDVVASQPIDQAS